MSNTWDRMLLYCSFNPRKNCMAWSSSLRCAMVVRIEQVHLMVQEQVGSGLKFSISYHMMRNFVKYFVTERVPCFIDDASCWRSEILKRSPYEYRDFRSLQISSTLSIHRMLCLMEIDTEWTIQDTTMLLQRHHAPYIRSVFNGSGAFPFTNSTLFLALNTVIMDLLHEW